MSLEKLLSDFYETDNLAKSMRLAYYTKQWGGIILLLRHDSNNTLQVTGTALDLFFKKADKYSLGEDLYRHMPREVFLDVMKQFDDNEILSCHYL